MKKIVIVGGGSTYTLPMIKTIADFNHVFNINHISLIDIDGDRQNKIFRASEVLLKDSGISISEHTNPEGVYEGAVFVFMQIRAGGLEKRVLDEKIPLNLGIVGQETCGPGGFTYGTRSIIDVSEIIFQVRSQNTECYIINYSNPAAIVAEATNRLFPEDKRIINLCDMPIAMMDGFASALGTTRKNLTPRYFGLNHFGWFTHLYDECGTDLLPKLKKILTNANLVPDELKDDKDWQHTFEMLSQMISDLDGYVPNTYLQYYLYPERIVSESDPQYTRGNSVIDGREKNVEMQCKYIIENQTIEGSGLEKGVHGKYIVELANSLLNNIQREFIMIIKNDGIISNLDDDVMVEVPCLVSKRGIEPLHVGKIPTFYKGLIESQNAYEKLTVDYVLNDDRDAGLKALALNRTVVDLDKAKILLNQIQEQNPYRKGKYE